MTPAGERRGRCPCGQCWMRGPSAEAAPGRGASRGGEAEARRRLEGHRATRSSAPAGCLARSATAGARRGPEPVPPAGGARTARRPGRSRRGAPGAPGAASRAAPQRRGRSQRGHGGRAAGGGLGGGRPEGGKEEGGEKGRAGGTRRRRRREGARQRRREGARQAAGGPGGGAGGGASRGRAGTRRRGSRASRAARPAGPHGNQRSPRPRSWEGGRAGGRSGAVGSAARTLQLGARRAGPALRARTARAEGLFMSPSARPPPLSCAPPPPRTPLGAPARPGLKFKSVQCRGGPPPACALPQGPAASAFRALPPPRGPGRAWGRALRGADPIRNREAGGEGGEKGEGARASGQAGGRPGSAVATAENGSLARPGPRAPPRPSPGPGGPARRGDPGGPRQGRGDGRGPRRGARRRDLPAATCGLGVRGAGGPGRGARAWGACPCGGRTLPRRPGGTAWGGVEPGSSLPPLRAVGAGWRRWRRRRRSVGAGREWARIPGPRGRGGLEGAGAGAARLEMTPVGMPGSPPCSRRPLPAHTHTHPRRAGVDVSLKASHLHSEGRGLAEAADRGVAVPTLPHTSGDPPSLRAAPAAVRVPPSPGLPTPGRHALPPRWRGPSWHASRARPRPPPQPLFAGPAALWLPNFILLSWSLSSWGHPLPALPPPTLGDFPLSLHPLLSSSPAEPAE